VSNLIKAKKGTKLTPDEFEEIKMLTSAKVPFKVIMKLTNRSNTIIGFIKKANGFDDYTSITKEYWNGLKLRKEQRAEKEAPVSETVATNGNSAETDDKTLKQILVLVAELNKNVSSMNDNLEIIGNLLVKRSHEETLRKNKFFSFGS